MQKTKLTLYINKEISKKAKKISNLSGKSVSSMVKDYFISREKEINNIDIDSSISKWIGILEISKPYKKLRDELIEDKLKKYENIS